MESVYQEKCIAGKGKNYTECFVIPSRAFDTCRIEATEWIEEKECVQTQKEQGVGIRKQKEDKRERGVGNQAHPSQVFRMGFQRPIASTL
jgi:hypothetical protein